MNDTKDDVKFNVAMQMLIHLSIQYSISLGRAAKAAYLKLNFSIITLKVLSLLAG